jgi:hypothetical protein
MPDNAYTRIARPKQLALSSSSLWIGRGHLLLVEHLMLHERYRRIFLEDVQAILCWRGRRREVLRWTLIAVSGSSIWPSRASRIPGPRASTR